MRSRFLKVGGGRGRFFCLEWGGVGDFWRFTTMEMFYLNLDPYDKKMHA